MSQIILPADLPENWTYGQIIAPAGAEAGLSEQHGYNYLMQQVNAAQSAVNQLSADAVDDEATIAALAQDTYEGVDLTVKFASEIANYNGDPWAWVKARLTAHNVSGIHVKDYIPFTTADGNTVIAQVAGINAYLRYNDAEVTKWHIDWVSKDCFPEYHQWNKVNYNNGLATQASPYLCSDLKAWLNAEAAEVPNATTVNPATVAVDYTTTGLFARLPATLQAVIVEKRALLSSRYSASGLLTDDNTWAWGSLGKLWVPSEIEVYGFVGWGTKGFSCGAFAQYDIFKDSKMRIKGLGNGGGRCRWWLLAPSSGDSTYAATVGRDGTVYCYYASDAGVAVPVCFRISE